jgi:hypothetical protein
MLFPRFSPPPLFPSRWVCVFKPPEKNDQRGRGANAGLMTVVLKGIRRARDVTLRQVKEMRETEREREREEEKEGEQLCTSMIRIQRHSTYTLTYPSPIQSLFIPVSPTSNLSFSYALPFPPLPNFSRTKTRHALPSTPVATNLLTWSLGAPRSPSASCGTSMQRVSVKVPFNSERT